MTNLKQLTTQYQKEHKERIEELKKLIIENSTNEEFIKFIKEINPSANGVYDCLMEIADKELYKAEVGKPLPFDSDVDEIDIVMMHLDEECIPWYLNLEMYTNTDGIVDTIKYSSYWE